MHFSLVMASLSQPSQQKMSMKEKTFEVDQILLLASLKIECYWSAICCPPQPDPSSNIGTFLTFKVDLCRQLGQSYHIWTFMPPMKSSTIVLKITKLDVCGTAPPPSRLINQTNPSRSESISSSLNWNYVSIESVHYPTKQSDHFPGVLPGPSQ